MVLLILRLVLSSAGQHLMKAKMHSRRKHSRMTECGVCLHWRSNQCPQ